MMNITRFYRRFFL